MLRSIIAPTSSNCYNRSHKVQYSNTTRIAQQPTELVFIDPHLTLTVYCLTHCTPTTLHTAPCHTVLRPTLEPQSQHSSDLVFFPQIPPGVDPYPKPTFDPCIRPTQTPSSQRVWPAEPHTRKPVCCYGTPRSDYLGHSQFYPIGIVWIFPSSSETVLYTTLCPEKLPSRTDQVPRSTPMNNLSLSRWPTSRTSLLSRN